MNAPEPRPSESAADLLAAYAQCFTSPAGGAVLADLRRHFDHNPYVADDPGGRKTACEAGKLFVLGHICERLEAAQRQPPLQETADHG